MRGGRRERESERERKRVDATKGKGTEGTAGRRVRRTRMRRRWRRRWRRSRSARGRRTSSDFSAVAAASERAALLCTSSLMASPVQPWLGSVLYHTAGRVPPTSPPPSPPSVPRCAPLPRPFAAAFNPLALSLSPSSSLYLNPSPLPPVASGVKENASLCFVAASELLLSSSVMWYTAVRVCTCVCACARVYQMLRIFFPRGSYTVTPAAVHVLSGVKVAETRPSHAVSKHSCFLPERNLVHRYLRVCVECLSL